MRLQRTNERRNGAILPLLCFSILGLFALVALAIDIGMIAVARAQAQNAADTAAMAGARSLNGDVGNNNNYSAATPAAIAAATANTVMGDNVSAAQCTIDVGSYYYNSTLNQFEKNYTGKAASDNYSLCRATVTATADYAFAKVLGLSQFNVTAQATSVHRPRDVSIIMDFSGSMRFQSLLASPHGNNKTKSMNPEAVFPRFGHYSDITAAALQGLTRVQASSGEWYDLANVTLATNSGPAIVDDFYKHNNLAGTKEKAFAPANSAYENTPGGDNFRYSNFNSSGIYAKTVKELLNITTTVTNGTRDAAFETNLPSGGYGDSRFGVGASFAGYTEGPNYWGKTFFIWPPDPRWDAAASPPIQYDWRKKFFTYWGSATRMDDNSKLWDTTGNWRAPASDYYSVDYAAILNWIKNIGPNPFPSQLRAGRILYYDAIPDSINTGTFPPSNLNERFWKEYIDHCLGIKQTGSSTWSQVVPRTGYGDDYSWGTVKVTAKSSLTGTPPPYMHYEDNPRRPRLHFWFGPMTMIDFIGNYNESRFWWPGTCHEAQCYQCKLGIDAALADIERNHPNDYVATMYFSSPKSSASSSGRYNTARVAMSRDYNLMHDALWFPFNTIGTNGSVEIRPYDSAMLEVPHAHGGTASAMGFMLAYNQFSSNQTTALRAYAGSSDGINGGRGRRGAQKVVVFETDGMANTTATATFTNAGSTLSYYRIRQGTTNEYPTVGGSTDVPGARDGTYAVADRMVALETNMTTGPGYATARKPVLIHCLAFGALFEADAAGTDQTNALDFLHTLQVKGSTATGSALPSYKKITGTPAERITKIRDAFRTIMQDGVQVTLIE
jgi:Flp pilus assembly protein TadG